jgi:quinol monooxygenase YgiN
MAGVRLVVSFTADSVSLADEAVARMVERCRNASQEPGCQQFEVFRSALDPSKFVLLELWESQDALDVHAQRNAANPPPARPGIVNTREDYVYNRTR